MVAFIGYKKSGKVQGSTPFKTFCDSLVLTLKKI